MIRTKLKQIHAAVAGDSNIVESGFEDVISSADSIAEVSFLFFFLVFGAFQMNFYFMELLNCQIALPENLD